MRHAFCGHRRGTERPIRPGLADRSPGADIYPAVFKDVLWGGYLKAVWPDIFGCIFGFHLRGFRKSGLGE